MYKKLEETNAFHPVFQGVLQMFPLINLQLYNYIGKQPALQILSVDHNNNDNNNITKHLPPQPTVGSPVFFWFVPRTYIKYDYELPPFSLPKVLRVNEYQGLETCAAAASGQPGRVVMFLLRQILPDYITSYVLLFVGELVSVKPIYFL
jgi:hypothetical protein